MRALAAEMVAVFRAQKVAREALAALLTFQAAINQETATVGLAQEIAAVVERARQGAPGLGAVE